eukprot:UN25158
MHKKPYYTGNYSVFFGSLMCMKVLLLPNSTKEKQ